MDTKSAKFPKLSQGGNELPRGVSCVRGAAILLVALAVCSLPTLAQQTILTPATTNGPGPYFQDTSTLGPNTVNGGNDTPTFFTGQCPWITSAMNAFCATNAGYTWSWANPTFNLQSDLSVQDYYAFVNTSPGSANGMTFLNNFTNVDAGGCEFGLDYQSTANGSPEAPEIRFIQAYIDNVDGAVSTNLDNAGNSTPWYGGGSMYGLFTGSMADQPFNGWTNAPTMTLTSHYSSVQFQTAVAVWNVVGVTTNITVYQGEEWWGFNWTATALPVPEPSTIILVVVSLLLLSASGIRHRRSKPSG